MWLIKLPLYHVCMILDFHHNFSLMVQFNFQISFLLFFPRLKHLRTIRNTYVWPSTCERRPLLHIGTFYRWMLPGKRSSTTTQKQTPGRLNPEQWSGGPQTPFKIPPRWRAWRREPSWLSSVPVLCPDAPLQTGSAKTEPPRQDMTETQHVAEVGSPRTLDSTVLFMKQSWWADRYSHSFFVLFLWIDIHAPQLGNQ